MINRLGLATRGLLILLACAGPLAEAARGEDDDPEGDREYTATCATMARVLSGIPPSAYAWSPIVLDHEAVVSINPDDPLMVTVICPGVPRIACMETYNPATKVGDSVRVVGRVRYADRKMILLDPCHSVPAT